ncbi:hypothetical protein B0H16DRAFT_1642178, partial [Mycena metata]
MVLQWAGAWTAYESTPRGIDTEGHVAAVAHCPVGVDAERVGRDILRLGIQPKLDVLCPLYEGKKISLGVVRTGGCRGRR